MGRLPTYREYEAYSRAAGGPPPRVLVRVFGSWRGALSAAVLQRGGAPSTAAAGREGTSVLEGMQL
ncbi:homing endonuclease associated repeat-containing protein [Desulfofundulus sp.]|uniref:homing endonuclease associated repeat-containing protein n=1 Tax=Desulfofundulus sp. TaxID=2282750 RepID=UPI003C74E25C